MFYTKNEKERISKHLAAVAVAVNRLEKRLAEGPKANDAMREQVATAIAEFMRKNRGKPQAPRKFDKKRKGRKWKASPKK